MPLTLLAILTPPEINETIKTWKQFMREEYGCEVALRSPAHITLVPPFTLNADSTRSMQHDLEEFCRQQQPFTVEINDFGSFPPRVIYANIPANRHLNKLKQDLEDFLLLHSYPVKKETRPFHPHITVANRDLKKEDFKTAWEQFRNRTYSATFSADRLSLLQHNGSLWITASETMLTAI